MHTLESDQCWGGACVSNKDCLPQDMTTLSYLNEPGVLWNLKCRYVLDTIYTYTGSILIAVNPFQRLPHLYGPHMMEQYRGRALGELDPHVYAIADSAYRQMRTEGKSQSILVRSRAICRSKFKPPNMYPGHSKCSNTQW